MRYAAYEMLDGHDMTDEVGGSLQHGRPLVNAPPEWLWMGALALAGAAAYAVVTEFAGYLNASGSTAEVYNEAQQRFSQEIETIRARHSDLMAVVVGLYSCCAVMLGFAAVWVRGLQPKGRWALWGGIALVLVTHGVALGPSISDAIETRAATMRFSQALADELGAVAAYATVCIEVVSLFGVFVALILTTGEIVYCVAAALFLASRRGRALFRVEGSRS